MNETTTLSFQNPKEYKRRIQAWVMYDWANSAFATTILGAVLPVYYSQVACANLPSEATATAYWSLGLSISLLIVAILSPILGTFSDVMRGKKKFLAAFASLGILATAFLVLIQTGDWLLASVLAILGRVGFNGSLVFYDALLPHVAKPEDQDRVSARGYAMGYLGGGLLLAVNVAMIFFLPGTWGPRLSFVSVAIWWAIFTIPLLRRVPEPLTSAVAFSSRMSILSDTMKRLGDTVKDVRRYRELFKYLLAFLVYNDGINTIIGVAAIYGAELGIGSVELILALLLVQFVGIPYSLIFGVLPSQEEKRRPQYLAFVIFNLLTIPLLGIFGARALPINVSGAPSPAYTASAGAVGEGTYASQDTALQYNGGWQLLNAPENAVYQTSSTPGESVELRFNGQRVSILYLTGPEHGIWDVEVDGAPLIDPKTGGPVSIDAYNGAVRYGVEQTVRVAAPGEHTLRLVNSGRMNPKSRGTVLGFNHLRVLSPERVNRLGVILGMILAVVAVGLVFAFLFGKALFSGLAQKLDTKRSIVLALLIYSVVAVWGFFLDSTLEFWCLAWMVAIVQGGSQALSRSLFAYISPASKSGEFFGLFSIMEKFASLIGPLMFAAAGLLFGSSRPAILSLILLFVVGGMILRKVNVEEGRRVALEEDSASGV